MDKNSGDITITIQLETDSTKAGPKGRIMIKVRDANGRNIAEANTDEAGRGGKPPGNAAITTSGGHASIPPNIANRAASIYVEAQCTGSIDRWFNISAEDLAKGIKVIVTALSG